MRLKRGQETARLRAAAVFLCARCRQGPRREEFARMPSRLARVVRPALAALLGLAAPAAAADPPSPLRVDWAYYSPVSLVLRDKGWMEEEFKKDGIAVDWVLSLGSNKA